MFLNIQMLLLETKGLVTVYSADTDIGIMLLLHFIQDRETLNCCVP